MAALEDFSLHDSSHEETSPFVPTRQRTRVANLADLNLEQELLDNYNDAQDILTNIDPQVTPANQIAQSMNTITSILDKIMKMRTELYNAERIKKIETAIIFTLKQYPELQETFMIEYERLLKQ